jgi:RHS repeat-associated protein
MECVYDSPNGEAHSRMTTATVCASRSSGKERDTESGNDYFGARYYASSMGRFMSPDWSAKVYPVPYAKLDNPQTLNLYAYVGRVAHPSRAPQPGS